MPHFTYTARQQDGTKVSGDLELSSASAVAEHLSDGGLIPVQIKEGQNRGESAREGESVWERLTRKKVGSNDLILFCRQMYSLTRSGVPIIRSLSGLIDSSTNPRLKEVLAGVIDGLESGRDLSEAMAQYPDTFPILITRMVQVGESSGNLEQAFEQLAAYLEFEKKTREQVKSALRYPSFVLIAIGVAIAILSLFVIPAFEKVFASFGAELPLATRIILAVSDFSVTYWPHILAGMAVAFFGFKRWSKTKSGAYKWDKFKLRLPIIGSILLRSTLARFARAFSMGYGSGVPLVQSLGFTARAIENNYIGTKLDDMRNHLERGETLTRSAAS
ncbi:MAG: type II secretion system F family protein, partial [Geobacteraceae bacterium]|nr:type II secretion system F family protein [Geobacteraceae bacterium]